MFPTMRRHEQALSEVQIHEILTNNTHGVLALTGEYPYALPVSYVYHDNKIIFHGANHGHKYDCISRYPRACFCVVNQDEVLPDRYTTRYRSVIAFGTIRILSSKDPQWKESMTALAAHFRPHGATADHHAAIQSEQDSLCVYVLEVEHLTGKSSKQ